MNNQCFFRKRVLFSTNQSYFHCSVCSELVLNAALPSPPTPYAAFLFSYFPPVPPPSAVPDSVKLDPAPPPAPTNPGATPSAAPCSGNGKRAPSGSQPQTLLQQQRYPPREVPPRFRQQEQKQLLKRGQPLPSGTPPPLLATGHPNTSESAAATVAINSSPSRSSSSSTASLPTGQPRHSVGKSPSPVSFLCACLKKLHNIAKETLGVEERRFVLTYWQFFQRIRTVFFSVLIYQCRRISITGVAAYCLFFTLPGCDLELGIEGCWGRGCKVNTAGYICNLMCLFDILPVAFWEL